jgi:2-dehydro-3-deoxyphosphooctonate aldolase (KDO 8-P synthase)
MSKPVFITPDVKVGDNELLFILGPCQIESKDHALKTASFLKELSEELNFNFVYKSSFDKANRTRINTKRGVGLHEGLEILALVKGSFNVPVITDIHSPEQALLAGEVCDVLQIPAFLCRQTDLLLAAGKSGKCINIKKGQFLHPADMKYAAEKVETGGSDRILLCERGTTFGYRDLVVDFRSFSIMAESKYPVIFDATHSVQSPGGLSGESGGNAHYVSPLARAAVAYGVDGVFIECHEDPKKAPSDGACMLPLAELPSLIRLLQRVRECVSSS